LLFFSDGRSTTFNIDGFFISTVRCSQEVRFDQLDRFLKTRLADEHLEVKTAYQLTVSKVSERTVPSS
jgi:hypothetical protein